MNIGRIKLLSWIAVAALGLYLSWDVYQFFTVGKANLRNLSPEEQKAVLDDVEAPEPVQRKLVPYPMVRSTFFDLNWTGKLPPKPKGPVVQDDSPKVQPKKPVSDLLTIVLIQYLSSDPAWSRVSIHYKPSADERLMLANTDVVLREGDHLPGKYGFISVSAIRPDYVEFAFEAQEGKETREPERVYPPEYKRNGQGVGIARVDETGKVLMPQRESLIPQLAKRQSFNYERSVEVGKNHWVVGHEDAFIFNRDYSKILTREVRTKQHRNRSGQLDGVQFVSIAEGSLVRAHGLQPGDIVKSINGEPVTSTQEAISYVKTHADITSHWVAVVERQGKDITLTYDYTPTGE